MYRFIHFENGLLTGREAAWRGVAGNALWSLDICRGPGRSVGATGLEHAISSVGAAYYGQHLHTDILIGQRPNVALSDLVRNSKAGSSGFINDRRWIAGRFSWQEGFGGDRCRLGGYG